jgi:hypothetical protein
MAISLEISDYSSRAGSFEIVSSRGCLTIRGSGRPGLIYGVYEFLYMQGYRWYYPGPDGEVFRGRTDYPVFPPEGGTIRKKQAMAFSRAFDFECVSMESEELILWMARNRMNVTTWRPATGPLGEKLGFFFKDGGHIFETILSPDRPMSSGRTLWEENEDWFGLPESGKREKKHAQRIQFCVSNSKLIKFLGDELIGKLMGVYYHADRVDVWGFDTWGSGCRCEKCKALGNGADITLYLMSAFHRIIDAARMDGRLDHDVALIMCSYEGTATLQPPSRPIPANISGGEDSVVFYPIDRCYAHPMNDSCDRNRSYDDLLNAWLKTAGHPALVVGEYYNVSKYEDLPLVLAGNIIGDIKYYARSGVAGMTYMHIPMVNWGIRTLTNVLYSRLMHDPDADTDTLLNEYFEDMYGPAAALMREYYNDCEIALKYIASWRAWNNSILSQLLKWDGGKPDGLLMTDCHFESIHKMLDNSAILLSRLENAGKKLRQAQAVTRSYYVPVPPSAAVNPVEENKKQHGVHYFNVCEALRGHIYATDVWNLMHNMAQYHTALYEDSGDADKYWAYAEEGLSRLETYYIPIGYEYPGAGLRSDSADKRSQLAEVVARARLHMCQP